MKIFDVKCHRVFPHFIFFFFGFIVFLLLLLFIKMRQNWCILIEWWEKSPPKVCVRTKLAGNTKLKKFSLCKFLRERNTIIWMGQQLTDELELVDKCNLFNNENPNLSDWVFKRNTHNVLNFEVKWQLFMRHVSKNYTKIVRSFCLMFSFSIHNFKCK